MAPAPKNLTHEAVEDELNSFEEKLKAHLDDLAKKISPEVQGKTRALRGLTEAIEDFKEDRNNAARLDAFLAKLRDTHATLAKVQHTGIGNKIFKLPSGSTNLVQGLVDNITKITGINVLQEKSPSSVHESPNLLKKTK